MKATEITPGQRYRIGTPHRGFTAPDLGVVVSVNEERDPQYPSRTVKVRIDGRGFEQFVRPADVWSEAR